MRAASGARIAFVAVGARVREDHGRSARVVGDLGVPHHLVETLGAAVQVVGAVIERELIGAAVNRHLPAGDPVAEAADDGSEEPGFRQIAIQVVMADDDVVEMALSIRNFDRHQDDPVGDRPHFHPRSVREGEHFDGRSVGHRTKRRFRHFRCNWHRRTPKEDRVHEAREAEHAHEETRADIPCRHPGLCDHAPGRVSFYQVSLTRDTPCRGSGNVTESSPAVVPVRVGPTS